MRPKKTRFCVVCGEEFSYRRWDHWICSAKCRTRKSRGAEDYRRRVVRQVIEAVIELDEAAVVKQLKLDAEDHEMIDKCIEALLLVRQQPQRTMLFGRNRWDEYLGGVAREDTSKVE